MKDVTVKKSNGYDRVVRCPADKSISVRAVILCSVAHGQSVVKNISACDDVMSAISCMRRLGAEIEIIGTTAYITGVEKPQSAVLDCGNSATTARLLTGLLCGCDGEWTVTGDGSLSARPFDRVAEPLAKMGAKLSGDRLPVKITGAKLRGGSFVMSVPSAQVKSALLLAALNADGVTTVKEPIPTRNHTEIMLSDMGANIEVDGDTVRVERSVLSRIETTVPGDVSAAIYPIAAALCIPGGRCEIAGVGCNPTRTAYLDLLRSMGADITVENIRGGKEKTCDIVARSSRLSPFCISGKKSVASMIDEIPMLCGIACFTDGKSVVCDADELRVKETDRIKSTVSALSALGADIKETPHGMEICGRPLFFGTADPRGDHRIAMTAAVAGACGNGVTVIGADCASVSFPNFYGEVLGV